MTNTEVLLSVYKGTWREREREIYHEKILLLKPKQAVREHNQEVCGILILCLLEVRFYAVASIVKVQSFMEFGGIPTHPKRPSHSLSIR